MHHLGTNQFGKLFATSFFSTRQNKLYESSEVGVKRV